MKGAQSQNRVIVEAGLPPHVDDPTVELSKAKAAERNRETKSTNLNIVEKNLEIDCVRFRKE